MDCREAQTRFSTLLDGELSLPERAEVEQHIAACADCRTVWQSLQSLEGSMRDASAVMRERAAAVADAVAVRLPRSAPPRPVVRSAPRTWLVAAVAMAFGFMLAVLLWSLQILPPQGARPGDVGPLAGQPVPPSPIAPAVIRAATGPVEYAAKTTPAVWNPVRDPDGFRCEPGVKVRTLDNAVCELQTSHGATVRMNVDTEVCFQSTDELELAQGEIWCRTPHEAALKVTAVEPGDYAPNPFSMTCGPSGPAICVFTCPTDAHPRITAASGQVELVSSGQTERLAEGSTVELQNGTVAQVSIVPDAALSDRWMHPLLIRKGPADPELFDRVNLLLARVGHTKVSYFFERDLRSLGEFGALPLLRFVQSPDSMAEADKRQTAAGILADVAPAWMVPELIGLLEDADATVRIKAALGLARLTGETQGVAPESWSEIGEEQMVALARWQQWWAAERAAWPAPPVGV